MAAVTGAGGGKAAAQPQQVRAGWGPTAGLHA